MVTWMAWHTWFWLQDDGELFGIFHSVLEFRSQLISLHSDPFSLEGPLGIVRRQSPQESNANIRFSLERWVTRYSPPMYSLGDVSMQSQQGSKVIDVFCFACKSHFKSRMSTAYYILRHEKRQCHQINIQQNVSVWADWCDWFMWSCVQNVWLHRLTKLRPCVFGWEMIWVPSWSFHHSKTATKGNFCIFSHLTIWYVLSCIICCCFISGDVRGCLVLPCTASSSAAVSAAWKTQGGNQLSAASAMHQQRLLMCIQVFCIIFWFSGSRGRDMIQDDPRVSKTI